MHQHKQVGSARYAIESYEKKKSLSFAKVDGSFGGLHNMAPNYPLMVNGEAIKTSEHLYQAMRFPHLPDIQELVLSQNSPMTAKIITKEHMERSRGDWDDVKVGVMTWCLLLKLTQNWETFGLLLDSTRNAKLVEYSKKDDFWGASPNGDLLVGVNALGKLLMKIRDSLSRLEGKSVPVKLINVPNALLLGKEIGIETSSIISPLSQLRRTTVVNKHHNAPFDIDIGRGSDWGNPFSHLDNTKAKYKVATLEESIAEHKVWFMLPEQRYLRDRLPELKGKILGCYCKPRACHGDFLAEMAEST